MNKIEYRLYKTDKNLYIPLLIEEVYSIDGSYYFICTRLRFIWKKTLTRGIVRYLLGLYQYPNTDRNYLIVSRTSYKSDYFFFDWLFKHAINEIKLIRSEELYI